MYRYERGLLIISVSSLIIYFLVKYLDSRGKYNWIKWYADLSKEEKESYNPSLVFKKMEYILIFVSIVGFIGLLLSYKVSKIFYLVSFTVIFLSFLFGMITTSRYFNNN